MKYIGLIILMMAALYGPIFLEIINMVNTLK